MANKLNLGGSIVYGRTDSSRKGARQARADTDDDGEDDDDDDDDDDGY